MIGLQQPSDRDHALRQLSSYVKLAQAGVCKDYTLVIAVSRLYPSLTANCHKAYQELADCFIYRNIHSEDPVIDYHAIRFTWKVYFPLNEIERASSCLVSGNEAECMRIVDDILIGNLRRHIHYHQLVPVVKTIFYYLIKQLEMSGIAAKEILALELEFNQKLESAYHYEATRDALLHAIRVIMDKTKRDHKNKLNPAYVANYIENNYMDNLHLDHMAEITGTSAKYFSNYFKKNFHINFVEYLNTVRLTHAKDLLKNTEMSVAEIGEKTGYSNASTFTSTFRKYWGGSPSEYRKQC
jgi:YesN/AraC family two-component response regulator